MAQTAKDDDTGPAHGSNVPDGEKVMSFVAKIENLDMDLASEKGKFMAECKLIQGDKKQVYSDAKAAGINKKALKGVVKQRALEREIKNIGDDLEGDDSDAFAALQLALEKLGPLGEAAMEREAA